MLSGSHDRRASVRGARSGEVATDREGTARRSGQDVKELTGRSPLDELDVDTFAGKVVASSATRDGVVIDHEALEALLRQEGG